MNLTSLVEKVEEHYLVKQPTLAECTATEEELETLKSMFNFTIVEAKIMYFLQSGEPVDLSLISGCRTHIYNIRKKLKSHKSNIAILSRWRSVYQLSIVGD